MLDGVEELWNNSSRWFKSSNHSSVEVILSGGGEIITLCSWWGKNVDAATHVIVDLKGP